MTELDLLNVCTTDRQRRFVSLYFKHNMNAYQAASELNYDYATFKRVIRRLKKHAGITNTTNIKEGLPPGSKRYDIDPDTGEIVYKGGWDQADKYSKEDKEALFIEALEAFKEELPVYKKIKPLNINRNEDLLNLYVLTDVHLGMLAWHEEGGHDWDLDIAERTIMQSFVYLMDHSPNSKTALLCNLGDFAHYDSMLAMTNASGHILDSDTRPYKLTKAASRILRGLVELLLKKYKKVVVMSCQGNHDERSSMWLLEILSVAYAKNKRVKIVESPKPHYTYKHGKLLLGFHHGHKLRGKLATLEDKFNKEFRKELGETEITLIHTGHFHEWRVDGNVEQHPTLAARDSYASTNLYNSIRAMRCITYHKERGEKSRITFNPE